MWRSVVTRLQATRSSNLLWHDCTGWTSALPCDRIRVGNPSGVPGTQRQRKTHWCDRLGRCVTTAWLTPTGKPPPLAVRLAKALPFQRAQVERRDALTVHDDLHTADGAYTQVPMVFSNTARHRRG